MPYNEEENYDFENRIVSSSMTSDENDTEVIRFSEANDSLP